MSRRLHYIDWLRVLAVLLLFPFHTSRVFNLGEDFYQKAPQLVAWLSPVLGFISTWHMQLLFLLAGASVCFSLRRRSMGQFSIERVQRLLVPFAFGFLVMIPPQTWIGARFNSGYTQSFIHYMTSGDFLVMNVRNGGDYYGGFGIGHLWFMLFLFILSLVLLPLFAWGRSKSGTRALERFARFLSHPLAWVVPVVLIWIFEGFPELEGLKIFYYLPFFALGFIVMYHDSFIVTAEKYWWWILPIGLALCRWWDMNSVWRSTLPDPSLALTGVNMLGHLGTWMTIVGFLGVGKRYLDRPSPTLAYLAEASLPIYILHQTVIVIVAFWLVRLNVSWPIQWLLVLAAAVAGSYGVYEIVRRVGVLRWLFGMRAIRREPTAESAAAK